MIDSLLLKGIAASLWQHKEMANIPMDPDACEQIATILDVSVNKPPFDPNEPETATSLPGKYSEKQALADRGDGPVERIAKSARSPLPQLLQELCQAIEKIPAGPEQTAASQMAAQISQGYPVH